MISSWLFISDRRGSVSDFENPCLRLSLSKIGTKDCTNLNTVVLCTQGGSRITSRRFTYHHSIFTTCVIIDKSDKFTTLWSQTSGTYTLCVLCHVSRVLINSCYEDLSVHIPYLSWLAMCLHPPNGHRQPNNWWLKTCSTEFTSLNFPHLIFCKSSKPISCSLFLVL